MRVLHCNISDTAGGASIAARRIHHALLATSQESRLYVLDSQTGDPTVLHRKASIPRRLWNMAANKIEYILRRGLYKQPESPAACTFNCLPWGNVSNFPVFYADVTHLHWINGRFFLPGDIARIQTPIIWTLHDRNPFTGGCHVRQGCERYKTNCGQCPQLGSTKEWDFSRLNWQWKSRALRGKRIRIVCPSRRLSYEARHSNLLGPFPITTIPNCVPTNIYRPVDKAYCRTLLNIPDDSKPLLLFGAISATTDNNKGYDLLTAALAQLSKNTYRCLIFGACAPLDSQDDGAIWLGRLHDDTTLALAYNVADVFICPSREENLPNTVMEALACGTPVVAFDIDGLPDMITHGEHGFLATPFDTDELAHHIQTLLNDEALRLRMGQAAREKVVRCYAQKVVAQQYMKVYEEILANS